MSKELYKLPKGWEQTTVGEIYDIIGGGTPSTSVEEYWQGDIAWVTSADIYGLKDIRLRKFISKGAIENSTTNFIPEGSLIVATRVGLGKVALVKVPLCFSQDVQGLVGNSSLVYPDYALYYLAQAAQIFKYQNRGTTIAGITKKQLSELSFALLPLPEQHRIVEAIEQQFSRLDEGVALLKQAQKRLKRYRASVLKAAVEGDLTAEWRETHPDREPASELLKRVLAERKKKWEEEQIAKGRDLTKVRYEEPAIPRKGGLPEWRDLPEKWTWATVEQLGQVQLGRQRAPQHHTGEHMRPYLRVANVFEGRIDISDVKTMNFTPEEFEIYRLRDGDVLLNEGQSLDLIGRPAIFHNEIPDVCFQNTLIRFRTCGDLLPQYALSVFRAYLHAKVFERIGKHTTNMAHLGASRLAVLEFPLPPIAEQQQIVTLVEERLSIIAELESAIDKALKWAERLRQSILHRAFTGQLVPQDPNDEPASILLERIRQERGQQQKPGQSRAKEPTRATRGRGKKKPEYRPARPIQLPDGPAEPIEQDGLTQQSLWQEEPDPEPVTARHDRWQNVNMEA